MSRSTPSSLASVLALPGATSVHSAPHLSHPMASVVTPPRQCALTECPHNFARILVGIGDSPRATLLSNQGILSRSFSLSDRGGGLDKWALARQAVQQLRTVARASDPQPVGMESTPHRNDRSAQSGSRGESNLPPPSKAARGLTLSLAVGGLPLKSFSKHQC